MNIASVWNQGFLNSFFSPLFVLPSMEKISFWITTVQVPKVSIPATTMPVI